MSARYMLDTDTCSYIMKRSSQPVMKRLRAVPVASVCISVITKSEPLYGVEAVAPYLRDLERRVKLQHEDEATEICQGIVLGLYRAEQRGFELLEYADECPSQLASHAVDKWRGRRQATLPRTFVQRFTPDWDWLLE